MSSSIHDMETPGAAIGPIDAYRPFDAYLRHKQMLYILLPLSQRHASQEQIIARCMQ